MLRERDVVLGDGLIANSSEARVVFLSIPRPTKNDLNKLKMLILAIQKHMNRLAMAIWKR